LIKITVKVLYLRNTKLWARTFFRICITHMGPHDAHSLDSKAIYHLERFPRKIKVKLSALQCYIYMLSLFGKRLKNVKVEPLSAAHL
jgi:hypothetical protein